jgi:hypothetical protein
VNSVEENRETEEEDDITEQVVLRIIGLAERKAKDRANAARWDLDIAVFAFSVLIIIMILLSQGVGIEITAIAAVAGLAMVWLAGWDRGRKLYDRFYDEEIRQLRRELKMTVKEATEDAVDEKVRKALIDKLS